MLSCGHRCPSVCGENCPSTDYCRECLSARSPVARNRGSDVVDLICNTSLLDHDPDDSPLLVPQCGHAWTAETLDGVVDLASFYDGQAAKPLSDHGMNNDKPTPACPTCRRPLTGIQRYGRPLKYAELQLNVRKEIADQDAACAAIEAQLDSHDSGVNVMLSSTCRAAIRAIRERAERKLPTEALFDLDRADHQRANQLREPELIRPCVRGRIRAMRVWARLQQVGLEAEIRHTAAGDARDETAIGKRSKSFFENTVKTLGRLIQTCGDSDSARSLAAARELEVSIWGRTLLVLSEVSPNAKENHELTEDVIDTLLLALKLVGDADRANCEELIESARSRLAGPHFQPVSTQEKLEIFRAMGRDVGTGVGSYGGHWFQCKNGHIYTIGECGGAMEESTCPECGEVVGGRSHRLSSTNRVAEEFLREVGGPEPRH